MRRNITDRTLRGLKPHPDGKAKDIWDGLLRGFGIRVQGNAPTKTFILHMRFPGSPNPTRRALGRYPAMTLEDARNKAREWIALVHRGVDPHHEEERQRIEALRAHRNSFALVAEDFIADYLADKRSGDDWAREIRRELVGRWGDRPVTSVTKDDVATMVREIRMRGAPHQARAVYGHCKLLFGWAIGVGKLDNSPCDRLKPKFLFPDAERTVKRKRTLSDDELRAYWQAALNEPYPWGPLFRLLLLTGQRRSEVAEAHWDEFDLPRKLWTIPAERMKNKAVHGVPLTDEMIGILNTLPRFKNGGFLFSTDFGKRPVIGFTRIKQRLNSAVKTQRPWVLHDVRRTVRSHLSPLIGPGITDEVRELVIAHMPGVLAQIYDQYTYEPEKRLCLELWGKRLHEIVGNEPDNNNNVVPLRAS
jgi:integrase